MGFGFLLLMDKILHHLLRGVAPTLNEGAQGLLCDPFRVKWGGGAGFRPSTVPARGCATQTAESQHSIEKLVKPVTQGCAMLSHKRQRKKQVAGESKRSREPS